MNTLENSYPLARHYPPGDLAIWIFILAELLVFSILFSAYAVTRMNNVELFNEFQLTLDREAALINTIALITSSYFVVRAIDAMKEAKGIIVMCPTVPLESLISST